MAEVFSYRNDQIALEIRQSGEGRHGVWILQKEPGVEEATGLGLVRYWCPDAVSAMSSIQSGHTYRAWDGAKLSKLGIPSDFAKWHRFDNDVGALD